MLRTWYCCTMLIGMQPVVRILGSYRLIAPQKNTSCPGKPPRWGFWWAVGGLPPVCGVWGFLWAFWGGVGSINFKALFAGLGAFLGQSLVLLWQCATLSLCAFTHNCVLDAVETVCRTNRFVTIILWSSPCCSAEGVAIAPRIAPQLLLVACWTV